MAAKMEWERVSMAVGQVNALDRLEAKKKTVGGSRGWGLTGRQGCGEVGV